MSIEKALEALHEALELVEARCHVCGTAPRTRSRIGEWTRDRRYFYCERHAPGKGVVFDDYQPQVVMKIRQAIAELKRPYVTPTITALTADDPRVSIMKGHIT